MRTLPGLEALVGGCDAMLIDQFGTLHDGRVAYPGAIAALGRLRVAGIRTVLLSNSGKRTAPNAARLAQLGFPADLYDHLLTSGEVGWRRLAEMPTARTCVLLSHGDDAGFLDGTGLRAVGDAASADLVVIAGSDGEHRPLDSYRAQLASYAERDLPAICLNPDRTVFTEFGLGYGAARIADEYIALGGHVTWIGKPHPTIYEATLALLPGIAPGRVIGIGDSAEHDIAGAVRAGCRAVLVRNGVIAGATDAELGAACAAEGVQPEAVLERFAW